MNFLGLIFGGDGAECIMLRNGLLIHILRSKRMILKTLKKIEYEARYNSSYTVQTINHW